jgi:hypothetical protein
VSSGAWILVVSTLLAEVAMVTLGRRRVLRGMSLRLFKLPTDLAFPIVVFGLVLSLGSGNVTAGRMLDRGWIVGSLFAAFMILLEWRRVDNTEPREAHPLPNLAVRLKRRPG